LARRGRCRDPGALRHVHCQRSRGARSTAELSIPTNWPGHCGTDRGARRRTQQNGGRSPKKFGTKEGCAKRRHGMSCNPRRLQSAAGAVGVAKRPASAHCRTRTTVNVKHSPLVILIRKHLPIFGFQSTKLVSSSQRYLFECWRPPITPLITITPRIAGAGCNPGHKKRHALRLRTCGSGLSGRSPGGARLKDTTGTGEPDQCSNQILRHENRRPISNSTQRHSLYDARNDHWRVVMNQLAQGIGLHRIGNGSRDI
jgi:hypothetical protein